MRALFHHNMAIHASFVSCSNLSLILLGKYRMCWTRCPLTFRINVNTITVVSDVSASTPPDKSSTAHKTHMASW